MTKKILSICIASYNRKDIIVSDVLSYLSLDDNRFIVTVQDDRSTDGAFEELEKISDDRLLLRRNTVNLGALQNAKAAMDNHKDCLYVLNLNDKDCLDAKVLPAFLDYLEKDKPYYGYVDLKNNIPFRVETINDGIDALKRLSYLCKHPSGFFWRSDLFHEEINEDYYKSLPPKFDYQFDLMYAHCAVRYPGVIVFIPLIINSMMRPQLAGAKSYSYTEENLYYGAKKRLETYELFLRDINILDVDDRTKEEIQYFVTRRNAEFVTTTLRLLLQHTEVCDHYNLTPRVVPLHEMVVNIKALLDIYSKYAPNYNKGLTLVYKKSFIFVRYTLSSFKMCVKELLWGFKQPTLVNA